MSKQSTVKYNKATVDGKFKKLEKLIGEKIEDQTLAVATYGIQISPVDTGAYVESFSIRPRGSSGGRMRSSSGRESLPTSQKQSVKQEAKSAVADDLRRFAEEIYENGGAVIINRAPHARDVERQHNVFLRMVDRYR